MEIPAVLAIVQGFLPPVAFLENIRRNVPAKGIGGTSTVIGELCSFEQHDADGPVAGARDFEEAEVLLVLVEFTQLEMSVPITLECGND